MSALERLASLAGIVPAYRRFDGSEHACSPETAAALLGAMGIAAGSEAEARASLERLEAPETAVRPEILVTAGRESRLDLPRWQLLLEDGGELASDAKDPGHLPPLPAGAHSLTTEAGRRLLIASPPQAPSLEALTGSRKAWGVTAALYGLRSGRNLGLGDYEDLARTCEALAGSGAAFLGINPLHARGVGEPGFSPYSASSRSGLDIRHIALSELPEFQDSAGARRLLEAARSRIEAARRSELVDYGLVDLVLLPALRLLYDGFQARETDRRRGFERWRATLTEARRQQSVFDALSQRHGHDWRAWPQGLQAPDSPAVRELAAAEDAAVAFYDWCQWIAEGQLSVAQARARAAGMALGLYLDIAVGVRPGGAETWADRQVFAVGTSLGAPPDALGPDGQNWGLAPYSPLGLRAENFASFRRMLRTTMAQAGMVRIDHAIGFMRGYWVPDSGVPGGYVSFPTETLLALTRIEAERAGCLVVGEDLGTLPEGLQEALESSGLYGCTILPFEREGRGFRPPERYRAKSLASFGTHDLPPMAGWWQGSDIYGRVALGRLGEAEADAARAEREGERRALLALLQAEGHLPEGLDPKHPPASLDPRLRDALHALLCQGRSELVGVALDDIFGVTEQQNVPGTVDEVPNWRRKAPVATEEIETSPQVAETARVMAPRR